MELPSICFIYPYIFMGIFIIIHIVIFLLILKFIPYVEKLAFLWGMINWTIAIGVLFLGIKYFIPFNTPFLENVKCVYGGLVPPITEDVGRFIVFTFIYKSKNHNFNNSIMFGAGHGGWESIVLTAMIQISHLLSFYAIRNAESLDELIKNKLDKTYEKYKNGVTGEEIFDVITRFCGNLFHMSASIIIYRLSLNRKEKKYIIYFIILFFGHLILDAFANFYVLYELSIWYNFLFIGLDIMVVVIGWLIWREDKNKNYIDFNNFETNDREISLENIDTNDN